MSTHAPWVALGLAVLSIALSILPSLDISVAARFYCPGQERLWCHKSEQPWDWFYHWGPLPGVACGGVGVILLAAGAFRHVPRWRSTGLFLVCTLILGPGILGNSIKPLWGRPRPRQVIQFGGALHYRPVWHPVPGSRGTSFPSGHATTAFSLGSMSVLAMHPTVRAALLIGSLVYGVLMGIARMAQGAHFATDVAWSATLAWVAIAVAAWVTRPRPQQLQSEP